MALTDEIEPKITSELLELGLELYELKFVRAGAHSVLRVFIEKEGGILIEDCKKASHKISEYLDEIDFYSGKYNLEVSSPGIDRPLTTQKDFLRVVGKGVKLRVENSGKKAKTVVGTLVKFENDILELKIKKRKDNLSIPFDNVLSGKIEIIF